MNLKTDVPGGTGRESTVFPRSWHFGGDHQTEMLPNTHALQTLFGSMRRLTRAAVVGVAVRLLVEIVEEAPVPEGIWRAKR